MSLDSKSPSPSDYDVEKSGAVTTKQEPLDTTSDRYVDGVGDLQVFKSDASDDLKLAKDGKTVLIPQPSDDPKDPLNWSTTKKHIVLGTLMFASLLTDYGMAYGVPLFEAQSKTFGKTLAETAHSISGGLFMQGPGGLFAVPLVQRYGRLPVLFWSQLLAALMVMAAALSPNYASFTAFRALQGTVNSAPQVIGLSIVHDMFFFHERTRKVNFWVLMFMGGPSLGPFVSAWMITAVSWRAVYGFLASLHGLAAILVFLFGQETLYDRGGVPQPEPLTGILGRVADLTGVTGYRAKGRPTLWQVTKDLFVLQVKPQVFFISVLYVTVLFCWTTGVTTTITQILIPPPYSFSQEAIALMFLGPLVASIIGELWGHWFNDWLCSRYIRRHKGLYVLENRLWGAYPPGLIAFACLILYGQALEHQLNWSALIIAWSGLTLTLIAGTTPISAYVLDAFPKHASLVAGILNMWRTAGGFCVNYFELSWADATGPATSFGLQAMIFGLAFIFSITLTQIFGQKWRQKYPPPARETN